MTNQNIFMQANPLLTHENLIAYSQIRAEHIEPAIEQILEENRARIAALLSSPSPLKFDDLILTMQEIEDHLDRVWSVISHLEAVASTENFREAYNRCIPKVTDYSTELSQNETLYAAVKALVENPDFGKLNPTQQKLLEKQIRDFRLSGVHLSADKKIRYAEIQSELASLTKQFGENVMDATDTWEYQVTHSEELKGIPPHTLEAARNNAAEKQLPGWLFTLDHPCYLAVLQNAENRDLRQLFYKAHNTRASDQASHAEKYDNSKIMFQILCLRYEESQLLGFANYAEYSLATKTLKQPTQVLEFLYGLLEPTKTKAKQELEKLTAFANKRDNIETLQPWDMAYYREKLLDKTFGLNDELFRPYLDSDHVINGLFTLSSDLFGINIREITDVDKWHPDVRLFAFYNSTDELLGHLYIDLFARPNKHGGAWVSECRQRFRHVNGTIQHPVAYLTCNLTPPLDEKPSQVTHNEALTVFHEYGHAIHHILTQVDYSEISGTNGVAWDAVEFPSQLMELFLWQKIILDRITSHYQTGEPLSTDLFHKLTQSRNFYSGLDILRQLQFALSDFELHLNFQPDKGYEQIQNIFDHIRTQTALIPIPAWNRFQHGFTHIFDDSYAAAYYSYLWAEVMSYNGFNEFLKAGVLNSKIGNKFRATILEQGGARDAMDLFIDFCGHKPDIQQFLQQNGILP